MTSQGYSGVGFEDMHITTSNFGGVAPCSDNIWYFLPLIKYEGMYYVLFEAVNGYINGHHYFFYSNSRTHPYNAEIFLNKPKVFFNMKSS